MDVSIRIPTYVHLCAVQLLEGSVASLPEGDNKTIWRT